jgi:hypothetical protein
MAEIEVFATDDETVQLAKWLLDQGCELIPDSHYETGRPQQLTDLAAIQTISQTSPHFFAVRSDWVESPLRAREVNANDKHFFYIDPRTGGPTMEFYWGRDFEKEGCRHLSASWLSFNIWYEDSLTGERKKPPETLRRFYAEFAKNVRSGRRRIKPGVREFWISPRIEALVRDGTVLIGLENMSSDQILGAQARC